MSITKTESVEYAHKDRYQMGFLRYLNNQYIPSSILILLFMLLKAALHAIGGFLGMVGGLSIWRVGILWSYGTSMYSTSTSVRANYKLLAPESNTFRSKCCTPSLENSLAVGACQIAGLPNIILRARCFIYQYLSASHTII